MDWNNLIGIGGTLGGIVLGFYLNRIDRIGKIKFQQIMISFHLTPKRGMEDEDKIIGLVKIIIDIYNSSRDPKIMRDLKLVMIDKNKSKSIHGIHQNEKLIDIIRIDAKNHIRVEADCWQENNSPIPTYDKEMKFYLEYFNESNKRKTKKVTHIKTR